MLQEEDFDSDTTDEDYIPNAGKGSDDDLSSDGGDAESDLDDGGDNEEISSGKSTAKTSKKKPKSKRTSKSIHKQKVNPLLAQLASQEHDSPDKNCAGDSSEVETVDQKKEEDLWADFLADTEEKPQQVAKPRKKSWAELLGNKKSKSSSSIASSECSKSEPSNTPAAKEAGDAASRIKPPESIKASTVKVTKIFEFAGEEVRVEEEVAADSAAARQAHAPQASSSNAGSLPVKRSSSNLSSLVSALGNKKQKLSTLEKTKLDWQSYKSQQGLEDELLLHTKSKDTYLDKQEFLQRADERQFEIERDIRQGSRRTNR
ncbi:BCNT-C domain [Trinorchestia longiramus]|nr:BCNT-C domain [Trinorchestia longiramus]